MSEDDINALLTADIEDTRTQKNGSLGLHRWCALACAPRLISETRVLYAMLTAFVVAQTRPSACILWTESMPIVPPSPPETHRKQPAQSRRYVAPDMICDSATMGPNTGARHSTELAALITAFHGDCLPDPTSAAVLPATTCATGWLASITAAQGHASAVLANDKHMRTMRNMSAGPQRRWPPGLSIGPGVEERRNSTNEWIWDLAMGGRKGQITPPAAGLTAPKLDDCRVFFNPVYRYIYIKNTKTAGSSVLDAMGTICPDSIMEAEDPTVLLPMPPCMPRPPHSPRPHLATCPLASLRSIDVLCVPSLSLPG